MGRNGLTILLVEDNPGDVRLAQEALKLMRPSHVMVARDGQEAMDILHRIKGHENDARPDLVLLDLNLPRKHGHEVLEEVKEDPKLRSIPIVVVSSSKSPEDVNRSYELHANCYVSKPTDLDRFFEVMKGIDNYWLELAMLPPAV